MPWNILNLLVICLSGVVAILYRNYLRRSFSQNPPKYQPSFRDIDFDTLYPDRLKNTKSSDSDTKRG